MNLKELAEHLGLSQTTVSRALNGYPEVSEATRQRVSQAATDQNYSPNARAKGLATGRAMAIGHVIPVANEHEMVNPVFGDFIAGAGEVYADAGYDMILSLADERQEAETYRKIKARGNVDGLIVHGPKMEDPRLPLLNKLGLPYVVHGRASEMDDIYSWLDVNNHGAFRRATEFLLDLGHRRISLVNGLESMDFAYRRREGFYAALENRGIIADPKLMRSSEMTEHYGYATAQEMLAWDTPPTAFLSSSVITAMGIRRAIEDMGLEIGKDVSIVTHDDDLSYLKNDSAEPIFTSTRSSVREAGRLVAQMLLKLIDRPELGPMTRLLEVDLVIGASTGPCPDNAAKKH